MQACFTLGCEIFTARSLRPTASTIVAEGIAVGTRRNGSLALKGHTRSWDAPDRARIIPGVRTEGYDAGSLSGWRGCDFRRVGGVNSKL